MTEGGSPARAETTGSSVGEAKWRAVRELKTRFPGLDDDDVEFELVEESDENGSTRVIAKADVDRWQARNERFQLESDPTERVRDLVERVVASLGLEAAVSIVEQEDQLWVSVDGSELGLFIGKRGQTIDAVQLLASLTGFRGSQSRKRVTVDAAGYRERREAVVGRQADRAAVSAVKTGNPVELAPMSASERRVVHLHLADRADVETHSVGDEPDRCVVVSPLG